MSPLTDALNPPTPRDVLARETDRVVDRVDSLGLARLAQVDGPVREAIQELADLAADAEGGPRRTVPPYGNHVLGSLLRILVADILATEERGEAQCASAARILTELRRALP